MIPVRNVRLVPMRPLSARQLEIIRMLSQGQSHRQIARALKPRCAVGTVRWHINRAAACIPGHFPASSRLIFWYRGASRELLDGM